jgi:hypothetical protein
MDMLAGIFAENTFMRFHEEGGYVLAGIPKHSPDYEKLQNAQKAAVSPTGLTKDKVHDMLDPKFVKQPPTRIDSETLIDFVHVGGTTTSRNSSMRYRA